LLNVLFRLLRFEGKESVGELIGAGSVTGFRTGAFDALKFVNHFIERLADHQFVDALGIARAATNRLDFDDLITLVGDDHFAGADVLRLVVKGLFHPTKLLDDRAVDFAAGPSRIAFIGVDVHVEMELR
jgi:hypothetical protein